LNHDIVFIPLGGGQRIGASSYYLRLGESNIILDAGTGVDEGVEFEPDFHCLLTSPFVQSMNQIGQIFVSHAHMDHIGCLLKLMSRTKYSAVYMTEITKVLTKYQLYERGIVASKNCDEDTRLAAQSLLENIAAVGFMKTLNFGKYKVTFYPAGHIPGAMMMLFEYGKRKILYTGDYSLNSTLLTPGCMLPENLNIDTVIMCGLHAKHPDYTKNAGSLYKQVNYILRKVEMGGKSVRCRVNQLSKGIEFLKALNTWNTASIPVYLDGSVMSMIENMEKLSVPVLVPTNRVMGTEMPKKPHIYLTADGQKYGIGNYLDVKVDFSLHEDFSDMKEFIRRINPRQAVIVHCGKEQSVFGKTIEQEIMKDVDCRTQFIFAEEKEIYML
jgi:Cft2 family RNA processing exonuclease